MCSVCCTGIPCWSAPLPCSLWITSARLCRNRVFIACNTKGVVQQSSTLGTDVYFGSRSFFFAWYTNESMNTVIAYELWQILQSNYGMCFFVLGQSSSFFFYYWNWTAPNPKHFQKNGVVSEETYNPRYIAVDLLWQWCAWQVTYSNRGAWSRYKAYNILPQCTKHLELESCVLCSPSF